MLATVTEQYKLMYRTLYWSLPSARLDRHLDSESQTELQHEVVSTFFLSHILEET